jgi:hypothetical protein
VPRLAEFSALALRGFFGGDLQTLLTLTDRLRQNLMQPLSQRGVHASMLGDPAPGPRDLVRSGGTQSG